MIELGDLLSNIIMETAKLVDKYGLLGVFIISFIGNAIPYATVPYLALIAALAMKKGLSLWDMIVWSIVGGLGAALGKVVVYLTGLGTSELLPERVKRNLEIFSRIAQRGIFIAIFLFAALPLPDDVLYIPLGIARYPLHKFFIAVWAGKVIITFLSIVFGKTYSEVMQEYNISFGTSIIILIVVTAIITIIIGRMDWVRIGIALSEKGIGYATVVMLDELMKALGIKKIIEMIRKISSSKGSEAP